MIVEAIEAGEYVIAAAVCAVAALALLAGLTVAGVVWGVSRAYAALAGAVRAWDALHAFRDAGRPGRPSGARTGDSAQEAA